MHLYIRLCTYTYTCTLVTSSAEIVRNRCLFVMINESAEITEDSNV